MTEKELRSREATPEDEPFLKELFIGVKRQELEPLCLESSALTQLLEMQYAARQQHYRATYPLAVTTVYELDEVPIAASVVVREDASIRLVDIAVAERMRGQGFGSAILRALQAERKSIWLSVSPLSPAMTLYQRLGFQQVGSDPVSQEMVWRP